MPARASGSARATLSPDHQIFTCCLYLNTRRSRGCSLAMSPSAKQKFLLAHNIRPALEVPPDDTKRGISAHTDASRLRHLAFAVDRVPPRLRHGLHLEFGVRNALSINFLAAKTDAYGAVWDGFDSFVGAYTEARTSSHPTRILTLTHLVCI